MGKLLSWLSNVEYFMILSLGFNVPSIRMIKEKELCGHNLSIIVTNEN